MNRFVNGKFYNNLFKPYKPIRCGTYENLNNRIAIFNLVVV